MVTVSVGQSSGDLCGNTNKVLQAAVDYVAALGGGVVEIGAGVFDMADSLHLRTGVTVRGSGPETILRKSNGTVARLTTDGDFGEEQITVDNIAGFEVGGGVTVGYENPGNFHTTVATIIARPEANVLVLNNPLQQDCVVARGALAQTTFPVISGYHVQEAVVEDIRVDGNIEANPHLGGCRGGGVFLYRAPGTRLSGLQVVGYNGDGISYQQSDDVLVENCHIQGCAGHGLHPGSGSQRPVIRNCQVYDCRDAGLFLCWRVKHGSFAGNVLNRNSVGISIGHKDTDNEFRRNHVTNNKQFGVLFRKESQHLAGHRNRFEENEITDNGGAAEGYGVCVKGETTNLWFKRNLIADTRAEAERTQRYGVYVEASAKDVHLEENTMYGHLVEDVHFVAS